MKGTDLTISESYGRETHWYKSSSLRGFKYQKSYVHQIKCNPLLSTLCIDDDAIMIAKKKIFLSGVQGIINGSLQANAPIVEIKGAKEEVETYSKTDSIPSLILVIQKLKNVQKKLVLSLRICVFQMIFIFKVMSLN